MSETDGDAVTMTDMEWPPPLIEKWLAGGGVNAERLAAELRAWAAFIFPDDPA